MGQGSLHFSDVLDSGGTFTFDLQKIKAEGLTEDELNNECTTDL